MTNDVDAALERAAASYAIYGTLPSYRRLLDEAGVDGPAGVVIAGDEDEVAEPHPGAGRRRRHRVPGLADRQPGGARRRRCGCSAPWPGRRAA